jgi:NTE family protein
VAGTLRHAGHIHPGFSNARGKLRYGRGVSKLGLALSGGGFRAAFFHVGVLARLAELDLLREIEVISTVSGGSIAGALYYLRLRRLLKEKSSDEITQEDYLELVCDVEERLRRGVQKNIRARVFANPLKNAQMLASRRYSRTDRVGDLYDRYLYKEAWAEKREKKFLRWERQIELRKLLITPKGNAGSSRDRVNLERDEDKIPALVINATSLNSGHNWRFEAVRMGEALPEDAEKRALVGAVDKNMRLEQGYFDPDYPGRPEDAPLIPEAQRDFPLALAVAASAAVPGIFHPLTIGDLYEGIRVQLVDGGVQDNQGIQALEDQSCKRMVISDASGQMPDKEKPIGIAAPTLTRTVSVAEDRIRDEQLVHWGDEEFAPVHLRMGLTPECIPPLGNGRRRKGGNPAGETDFGVAYEVQDLLSRIRTDLDYFSDTEALALEMNGYMLATHMVAAPPGKGAPDSRWPFLALREKLEAPDDAFLAELRAGQKKFLRAFQLQPTRAKAVTLVLLGTLLLLGPRSGGFLRRRSWPEKAGVLALAGFLLPSAWSNLKARMPWLYHR